MIIQLPPTIKETIDQFSGRTWLLPEIHDWLARGGERFFLLTGAPGTGKSMIMAWLAERVALAAMPKQVVAAHFLQANTRNITPQAFAQAVANQLTERLPGFGDALKEVLADRIIIQTVQEVGPVAAGGSVTGVAIGTLNLADLEDSVSFDRTFVQPLQKFYENGYDESLLVLVDALDEAWSNERGRELVRLLAQLSDLPKKVRILATSRPDRRFLKLFSNERTFDLVSDAGTRTAGDITSFARTWLQTRHGLAEASSARVAGRIANEAEGIFLYAYMVLCDVIPNLPSLDAVEQFELPSGLGGLYHEFLNRELGQDDERWYEEFRPLLGLIAVAQGEGLTRKQLRDLLGYDPTKNLRICHQYLSGELNEGPFRVFHKSLADYLLNDEDNTDYEVDAAEMHGRLADAHDLNATDWRVIDLYFLRYLPLHLQQARRKDTLRQLLLDYGWLQAKLDGTDPGALLVDYDYLPADPEIRVIRDTLKLSAPYLAVDKTQLAGQLLGRLLAFADQPGIEYLLTRAKTYRAAPWLRPLNASLAQPSGAFLYAMVGHSGPINDLAVTPSGNEVISASSDTTLRIWDLKSGETRLILRGHRLMVTGIAITADGDHLVSSAYDGSLIVWELAGGNVLRTLENYGHPIEAVAIAPDGSRILFAGARQQSVGLWELTAASGFETLEGHSGNVIEVFAMPNGSRAISLGYSSSGSGEIILWDLDARKVLRKHEIEPVMEAALTPDGRRIITELWGHFAVWDVETGNKWRSLPSETVWPGGVVASGSNSREAVLAAPSGRLEVWDIESGSRLRTLSDAARSITSVTMSPDGSRVITGDHHGTLEVWDSQIEEERTHNAPVTAIAMDGSGAQAVSGHSSGLLRHWDAETATLLNVVKVSPASIIALDIMPERQYVVVSCGNRAVTVWDLQTANRLVRRYEKKRPARAVAATPDGGRVIIGGPDGYLRLWDIQVDEIIRQSENCHLYPIDVVGVSSDGNYAISISWRDGARIWDLSTLEERTPDFGNPLLPIYHSVVIPEKARLPDAAWIANREKRLLLLSLAGRQLNLPEPVHYSLVFPNLQRFIKLDKYLAVFDWMSGQKVATFSTDKKIHYCSMSSDGQLIVAGGDSGQVHFLRLEGLEESGG